MLKLSFFWAVKDNLIGLLEKLTQFLKIETYTVKNLKQIKIYITPHLVHL